MDKLCPVRLVRVCQGDRGLMRVITTQIASHHHKLAKSLQAAVVISSDMSDMSAETIAHQQQYHTSHGRRFHTGICQDPLWGFLWMGHFMTMIIIGALFFITFSNDLLAANIAAANFLNPTNAVMGDLQLNNDGWTMVLFFLSWSTVMSFAWLEGFRRLKSGFLTFTLAIMCLSWMSFGIISILAGQLIPAIIFFILGGINVIWSFSVRGQLDFTSSLFDMASTILLRYPAINGVVGFMIILQVIWNVIWVIAAASNHSYPSQSKW